MFNLVTTDQIGRPDVLLPINHNYNKLVISKLFLNLKHKKFQVFFFAGSEKKPFKCARAMAHNVQYGYDAYRTVLIVLKSGQLIANQNFFIVMINI